MSWPPSSHASSSQNDPFVDLSDIEADVQGHTNILPPFPQASTSNMFAQAAQFHQYQHEPPSLLMQAQYQLFTALFPSPPQPSSPFPSINTDTLHLPLPSNWPELFGHCDPRPVAKANWVEFVDSLEWLVNADIRKEDRICPFCWGEFGPGEEDEVSKEEGGEGEGEGGEGTEEIHTDPELAGNQDFDENEAKAVLAPTLNSAAAATVSNNSMSYSDSEANNNSKDAYEPDDEEDSPPELASSELQGRSVRGVHEETGLEQEPEKISNKHYAVKLQCGHLFGHMCLVSMLESGEMVCPKCRKNIVQRSPAGQ